MKRIHFSQKQGGFTIVELMIATLVFSTILLVITYGVLHFTNAYYKGINSSTTQDTTRTVIDTVAQAVQFSGTQIAPTDNATGVAGTVTGGGYFCAANQVFVYKIGVLYAGGAPTATNPGLYAAPDDGTCNFAAVSYSGGKELLSSQMRVADLHVTNLGNQTYTITTRLAYGGSDLLCSPKIAGANTGSCQPGAASYLRGDIFAAPDLQCKLETGSQFCAVSGLSTTVIRRVSAAAP